MTNLAWHFTGDTLRDGSPIPEVGQKLIFKGDIKICSRGYHWSKQPFDALQYAPGSKLHLVEYGGTVLNQSDKGCSSERTILKSLDATTLLRRFAADQALSVANLWEMPDVVREYLTTLDEKLRAAAAHAAVYSADAYAAYAAVYSADAYAAVYSADAYAAYAAARAAAADAASDAAYAAYAAARAAAADAASVADDAAYAARSAAADAASVADDAAYAARSAAADVASVADDAAYAARSAAYDAARKDFNTRVYKTFNMEVTQ